MTAKTAPIVAPDNYFFIHMRGKFRHFTRAVPLVIFAISSKPLHIAAIIDGCHRLLHR